MSILDIDEKAFERTLANVRQALLQARNTAGFWEGRLSSSALSTATAVSALAAIDRAENEDRIARGLNWLMENRNEDGGFGDSPRSPSNISTSVLAWSAFIANAGRAGRSEEESIQGTERWLAGRAGGVDAPRLARALSKRYGMDRTFSAPILAMCAINGALGAGRAAWRWVHPLPFELAAMPHRWLKRLNLSVVSYALPALVAIGQARFHRLPPVNPFTRLIRLAVRKRTLRLLERIQPAGGGFLEAIPLTSFVTMSLAAAGKSGHPVAVRSVEFLKRSQRPDGSWPIDVNLATWLTTLSVNGLAAGSLTDRLSSPDRRGIAVWLLDQQYREEHPYTRAAPGGWAWTDLTGGVPDADDTAGVLIALRHLAAEEERSMEAACAGIQWLAGLQNRDGGIPTFCRGWGKLPFDRSSADLTAHALRAAVEWSGDARLPEAVRKRAARLIQGGLAYLMKNQDEDGSWIPLWFGNQHAPREENPCYGTARVVSVLADPSLFDRPGVGRTVERGVDWLLSAQGRDGGFGGAPHIPSSIEETALSVHALAAFLSRGVSGTDTSILQSLSGGVRWLIERTGEGRRMEAAPIGLYFAKLWYFEELYPMIFTAAALEQVEGLRRSP